MQSQSGGARRKPPESTAAGASGAVSALDVGAARRAFALARGGTRFPCTTIKMNFMDWQ
jgi:hypothetical protein